MRPDSSAKSSTKQWTLRILRQYGTLSALVVLMAIFSAVLPGFATWNNVLLVTQQISFLVVMAIGATLVMAVAEFDLSLAAMASLGGVTAAELSVVHVPVWLAFVLTALMGAVVGVITGWLVTTFHLLSFIVTLALSTALGGIALAVSGGTTVFDNIPNSFLVIGQNNLLGMPIPIWIMLVFLVVTWLLSAQTPFGRRLYAVGGNEAAAKVAGLTVGRLKVFAFAASGLLSAFTGAVLASRLGSASPAPQTSLFLQAYAATFLGMTMFEEGVPNVWGTFIGALLIGVLENGLTMMEVSTSLQDALTGVIVIAAIMIQRIGGRRA